MHMRVEYASMIMIATFVAVLMPMVRPMIVLPIALSASYTSGHIC